MFSSSLCKTIQLLGCCVQNRALSIHPRVSVHSSCHFIIQTINSLIESLYTSKGWPLSSAHRHQHSKSLNVKLVNFNKTSSHQQQYGHKCIYCYL